MSAKKQRRSVRHADGTVTVAKYNYIFGGIFGAAALLFLIAAIWESIYLAFGLILLVIALPFLIYAINYRVTMNKEGITVRNFFRVTTHYAFSDIRAYRENLHYTYLYFEDGKHIRIKDEDGEDVFLNRLLRRAEDAGAVKKKKTSGSALYWGNCSRPVQLTLFLGLMWMLGIVCAAIALMSVNELMLDESRLLHQHQTVVSVSSDGEWITLDTSDGSYHIVDSALAPERDWNDLEGHGITILTDSKGEMYALTDSRGEEWFTFEEYYESNFGGALGAAIVCGVICLLPVVFTVLALLAYHDPERFSRLYDEFETMDFWRKN